MYCPNGSWATIDAYGNNVCSNNNLTTSRAVGGPVKMREDLTPHTCTCNITGMNDFQGMYGSCSGGCSNSGAPCGSPAECQTGGNGGFDCGPGYVWCALLAACLAAVIAWQCGAFCFKAGTKVKMADGTDKDIEDVEVGDEVISWNEDTGEIETSIVKKLMQPIHDDIVELEWEHGTTISTFDHPFWSVVKQEWSSYKSELTLARYDFDNVDSLSVSTPTNPVGDIGLYLDEDNNLVESKLLSMKEDIGEIQTYIFELEGNKTFFANNTLTHNKCCFLAGTKISMADGTEKNIEDVKIGDFVKSFNEETKEIEDREVLELQSPIREGYYNLYYGETGRIQLTNEHPLFIKKADGTTQWSSIEPDKTKEYYPHLDFVGQIETPSYTALSGEVGGDSIYTIDGNWEKVKSWEYVEGEVQTYNLWSVENNKTFFANGLLAHNRGNDVDPIDDRVAPIGDPRQSNRRGGRVKKAYGGRMMGTSPGPGSQNYCNSTSDCQIPGLNCFCGKNHLCHCNGSTVGPNPRMKGNLSSRRRGGRIGGRNFQTGGHTHFSEVHVDPVFGEIAHGHDVYLISGSSGGHHHPQSLQRPTLPGPAYRNGGRTTRTKDNFSPNCSTIGQSCRHRGCCGGLACVTEDIDTNGDGILDARGEFCRQNWVPVPNNPRMKRNLSSRRRGGRVRRGGKVTRRRRR